jgi:hypothetical protein
MPLAGKILVEPAGTRRRSRNISLLAAGGVGGVVVAILVLAGYVLLTDTPPQLTTHAGGKPAMPTITEPVALTAPHTIKPKVAVSAAEAIVTGNSTPSVAPPPQTPPARLSAAPVKEVTAPIHPSPVPALQGLSSREPSAAPVKEAPLRQVTVAARQIPSPGQQWTAPHLVVTEILSVNGEGGRMAVVNGLPVMEGTRVEDALVKEIRAGQVLFETGGKSIVVPLQTAD